MEITSELSKSLAKYLSWNKARLNCFARMVIALLRVRTVNLMDWSSVFHKETKPDSSYMRIRRFFRSFNINFDVVAGMLFKWFGLVGQRVYLVLDRTQWEFGKKKINILMLGVVYQGIAIPLYWSLIPKKGTSSSDERVHLLNKFIKNFGVACIAGLLADREFIGKRWFHYLRENKIPYYIRLKQNMLVSNAQGRMTNALFLFSGLQRCEKRILATARMISGCKLFVAGVRCPDGGYLIIATTEKPDNAIEIYRHRWEIETLFGCLKTRGFNFEDTHLADPERLMKLISVLAIGFAWAHKIGEWCHTIKPITIKNHGRKAESIFHCGFKKLRHLLWVRLSLRFIKNLIRLLETPQNGICPSQLGAVL